MADGIGGAARFNYPYDVKVDTAGNVYVADTGNELIRKITPDGTASTLARLATNHELGSALSTGIALDSGGNIYATDNGNQTIRKVTPFGTVSIVAGATAITGSSDGTSTEGQFNGPNGIAVDQAGNLYVADTNNQTIRLVSPATGNRSRLVVSDAENRQSEIGIVKTPLWAR